MFYTEVIIVFSLLWAISGPILWYIIYRANLAAMNKHVENMEEEDEDCCAGEGYCEREREDAMTMDWKRTQELANKMGGKEIPAHGISATTCGYTPPKKDGE